MGAEAIPEAHKELIRAGWAPPRELRTPALLRWVIEDQTVTDENGCWVWQGKTRFGRGQLWGYHVHRLAYTLLVGEIPKGLHLDHLCRNRACCRPEHLEPVTQAENNRRAMTYVQKHPGERVHQAAKRWCKWGHPFDETNTGRDGAGKRYCKTCRADYTRRSRAGKQTPRGRQWHIDETRWAELRPEAPFGLTVTRKEMAALCGFSLRTLETWFCNHRTLLRPMNPGERPLRYWRSEVVVLVQCRTDQPWAKTGPNVVPSSYRPAKGRRKPTALESRPGIRRIAG